MFGKARVSGLDVVTSGQTDTENDDDDDDDFGRVASAAASKRTKSQVTQRDVFTYGGRALIPIFACDFQV